MHNMIDMTGRRFARLVVVERASSSQQGSARWLCKCDCGQSTVIQGTHLRSGHTQSCGCLHSERTSAAKLKHGGRHTSEYNIWTKMKSRCTKTDDPAYENYGGRGILVCDEWFSSFEQFMSDMGPRPSVDYSIDRIDNDGDYEPRNCKWSTRTEQANNKRNNYLIEVDGITLTAAQWSERTGISPTTIKLRIRRYGWTTRQAIGIDAPPAGSGSPHRAALFGAAA